MLRITVELVPLGDEAQAQVLGTATITNDGTGSETKGNYQYELTDTNGRGETFCTGNLQGYSRGKPGNTAWDLLFWVLFGAVSHRNVGAFDAPNTSYTMEGRDHE